MTKLDLNQVERVLRRQHLPWMLEWHARCDSTQDLARAAAERGVGAGLVVLADEQLYGRGRHGARWHAPPAAAILLSALLRPPPQLFGVLPLMAGIAVVDAVRETTGLRAQLKWPNDVLVMGRKLSGILCERPPGATVVLGLGVNVNLGLEQLPLETPATSLLLELGREVPRELIVGGLLNHLDRCYGESVKQGPSWVTDAWRQRSSMLGQTVIVTIDGRSRQGIAEDLDQRGGLLVRFSDSGLETIVAGDVRQLRLA